MEAAGTTSIQDLPVEVLEHIFQLLSAEDLDACFNVCLSWKFILNSNRMWKRWCIYPEKYFKTSISMTSQELCIWRQNYERQQRICENWSKGQYTEETILYYSQRSILSQFVDDHGNHWLFENSQDGINVWNITNTPTIHCTINEPFHLEMVPLRDKILIFGTNYVKVYSFSHPAYQLHLQCRFLFERDDILSIDEVIPDDHYISGVRYILVGYVFIGYSDKVTNIHEAFLHIWDIKLTKKITTESVFQQSYVDFIKSVIGNDVTQNFEVRLLLFSSDSNRFLVNLIDDRFELCQISLYSLDKMRFDGVIVQLQSRTAWCDMEGDIVVVHHIIQNESPQVSVFNVNGHCLTRLDYPGYYYPAFNKKIWFDGSKLILKVDSKIHVVNIINSMEVKRSYFKVGEERFIETFVDPKFLLLYNKLKQEGSGCQFSHFYSSISVWNIESGQELWTLKNATIFKGDSIEKISVHPWKLILCFPYNNHVSILNFEKGATKKVSQSNDEECDN